MLYVALLHTTAGNVLETNTEPRGVFFTSLVIIRQQILVYNDVCVFEVLCDAVAATECSDVKGDLMAASEAFVIC